MNMNTIGLIDETQDECWRGVRDGTTMRWVNGSKMNASKCGRVFCTGKSDSLKSILKGLSYHREIASYFELFVNDFKLGI